MPRPTPPDVEPVSESELYRYHLDRLITWYLKALDPLPAEVFTWQPPTPETNTLAAICNHAISSAEWWILSCVGTRSLERDSESEFTTAATWAELRPRYVNFLTEADALLAVMDSEQLGAISRHPSGKRTNRRCVAHPIEHLGLHLGHVEVTIDWWKSAHA